MNTMMKWTLFFGMLMLIINPGHAYTIAQKGRVNGPSIHTTYFLTPNNEGFNVKATALPGNWVNGSCVYTAQYPMGIDFLRTGDFVDFDAFRLKAIIGNHYSCLTIFYHYTQPVMDTYQLVWDGFNYSNSIPATSEVTIL